MCIMKKRPKTNYAKEDWFEVVRLDAAFQWQGPLKRPMLPSDPWYRELTDDQLKADVYDERNPRSLGRGGCQRAEGAVL